MPFQDWFRNISSASQLISWHFFVCHYYDEDPNVNNYDTFPKNACKYKTYYCFHSSLSIRIKFAYLNLFLRSWGCVAKRGRVKGHGLQIHTFVVTLQATIILAIKSWHRFPHFFFGKEDTLIAMWKAKKDKMM